MSSQAFYTLPRSSAKYITNACHSRACPSCGKKASNLWIAAQLNRLPDCDWIHLVFMLPDSL